MPVLRPFVERALNPLHEEIVERNAAALGKRITEGDHAPCSYLGQSARGSGLRRHMQVTVPPKRGTTCHRKSEITKRTHSPPGRNRCKPLPRRRIRQNHRLPGPARHGFAQRCVAWPTLAWPCPAGAMGPPSGPVAGCPTASTRFLAKGLTPRLCEAINVHGR